MKRSIIIKKGCSIASSLGRYIDSKSILYFTGSPNFGEKNNQITDTKHPFVKSHLISHSNPQQIIQISRLSSNSNGGNLIMLNKHQTQSATTATSQMFPAFTPPLLERKICAKFSTRVSSRKSNLHPPISSPTQLPLLCS